ncbi:MAG TPA: hypothetical protein VM164_08275 [Burkholderiales bacterium]|nr:hypothetical protein [Burkholderiales bacterium]
MKRMTWMVAFAAATAASAYAQQTYEPTVPRGLSESRVEPSGTLAPPVQPLVAPAVAVEPAVPQLAMNVRRHQRDADARQCLQLATNVQVHRCAERYRSHASRAQVSKAALKKTTAPATASAVVQEKVVVQSKTGEPPKPVETAKILAPAPVVAAPPGSVTITTSKTTVTTTQPAPKPVEPVKTTK